MLLPLNYKIMYNITLQKYFYERIDKFINVNLMVKKLMSFCYVTNIGQMLDIYPTKYSIAQLMLHNFHVLHCTVKKSWVLQIAVKTFKANMYCRRTKCITSMHLMQQEMMQHYKNKIFLCNIIFVQCTYIYVTFVLFLTS